MLRVGPILASGLVRSIRLLVRWTRVGEETVLSLHRQGRPYVHAFYHDQLLMMTYSYIGRRHGRRLAVLSSRHRDGEYVSRMLEKFGHIMVRGSTGRGGVGGLKKMIRHLREGNDAAFAVDGPRGPRHQVQMGAIEAARLGAAPIVPVAFAASRAKKLRSWDAFQVPWPFSRCVFIYGDPIMVHRDADRGVMEEARRSLQEHLDCLTARAQALVQAGTDPVTVQPHHAGVSRPAGENSLGRSPDAPGRRS